MLLAGGIDPDVQNSTLQPLSGEMPLQSYNSTLCLSRILAEADSCICFSNDELLTACLKQKARVRAGGSRTTVRPTEQAKEQVKFTLIYAFGHSSKPGVIFHLLAQDLNS